MSIVIPGDEKADKEAASNSGKPLPAGKYIATIVTTKKDGSSIELVDYANSGANAGKKALNVRFRIEGTPDGAPTGKGRNVFARVGLFKKFAATGRGTYPDGAPNFLFYNFFESLGFEVKGGDFTMPDPKSFLGKQVELVLEVREPDQYNEEGSNEVHFINPATPLAQASVSTPQSSADIWNTSPTEPVPAETPASADIWAPAASAVS